MSYIMLHALENEDVHYVNSHYLVYFERDDFRQGTDVLLGVSNSLGSVRLWVKEAPEEILALIDKSLGLRDVDCPLAQRDELRKYEDKHGGQEYESCL